VLEAPTVYCYVPLQSPLPDINQPKVFGIGARYQTITTGWSKSLCAPDDYNTENYKLQSDCLATDRQGREDTRLTLTPSVTPNSNYVIMVIETV
jgi:hypothetical protein